MAKPRITITIDKELLDWIDEQIGGKVFSSRWHAIERCVYEVKERSEE